MQLIEITSYTKQI